MGWERRGNQLYYYQASKIGGRTVKHYVGTGPLAELVAEEDTGHRGQREVEAETWRQEQARLTSLDDMVTTCCDSSTVLAKAVLYAAGYHQHDRGAWRKRRGQSDRNSKNHS